MKRILLILVAGYTAGAAAPRNLSSEDWRAIQTEVQRQRRMPVRAGDGWQARYSDDSRVFFDGRGFELTPKRGAWRWGLRLTAYGYEGQLRQVTQAKALVDQERLSYAWDSTLREWWRNGDALEHGYTVAARPGQGQGLEFHLEIRGGLIAQVSADGRNVGFAERQGAPAVLRYVGLKVVDASGRELPARFREQAGLLRLHIEDAGARYPITVDPTVQIMYLKLQAQPTDTTRVNDFFGWSVAISEDGNTVVVGAPEEDSVATGVNGIPSENTTFGLSSGAAYVFSRSGATWTQEAFLKGQGDQNRQLDNFGKSVAISGDMIVVGVPGEDSSSLLNIGIVDELRAQSGAAFVYTRSYTAGVPTWALRAYLKPAAVGTNQAGDAFGTSVAASGDTIVIGAPGEDSDATGSNGAHTEAALNSGAAYVFLRSGTAPSFSFSQQAYLKPAQVGSTQAGDAFGTSVAIQGNMIVVGAPLEDSDTVLNASPINESRADSGAAYVFSRSGTTWSQVGYLKPASFAAGATGQNFGASVAISGNTVAVGAPHESSGTTGVNSTPDTQAVNSGAAFVFVSAGTAPNLTWSQEAYLKPFNTEFSDEFGGSIGISGDTIVVGARNEDGSSTGVNGSPNNNASQAGAAYIFVRSAGFWNQQDYLKPASVGTTQSGDQFGNAVAIAGTTVVAGAPLESSGTTLNSPSPIDEAMGGAGAAYVFTIGPAVATAITINTSPQGLTFTSVGAGCEAGTYTAPRVLNWVPGSSCTLSVQSPQNGQYFSNWADGVTTASRVILATASPATYTANFINVQMTVNMNAPGGTFTVSGSGCQPGNYPAGQTLNVAPSAACTLSVNSTQGGMFFINWDNASTNPTRNVVVPASGAVTYTANYTNGVQMTVSTNAAGLTFSTGGPGCQSGSYPAGQPLTVAPGANCALSVPPSQGGLFFWKWEDGSTNPVRAVTVPSNGAVTYTATYSPQVTVSLSAAPSYYGFISSGSSTCSTSCTEQYAAGSVRTFVATPSPGSGWVGWGGACQGQPMSGCTLTLNGSVNISATFVLDNNDILIKLLSKSSFGSNRLWTFTFYNWGPEIIPDLLIDKFWTIQTGGPPCTVSVVTPLPLHVGPIPVESPQIATNPQGVTFSLELSFTGPGCATAPPFGPRWTANIGHRYTLQSGAFGGAVFTLFNQFK